MGSIFSISISFASTLSNGSRVDWRRCAELEEIVFRRRPGLGRKGALSSLATEVQSTRRKRQEKWKREGRDRVFLLAEHGGDLPRFGLNTACRPSRSVAIRLKFKGFSFKNNMGASIGVHMEAKDSAAHEGLSMEGNLGCSTDGGDGGEDSGERNWVRSMLGVQDG
ncbi:hypothetical protein GOP47_0006683 [Adiantum capillus-veneris]|uniref:Uncharacterized protein n=1 Tax=Adiantum capillus-veneris TaxID=13818 RepID=A0A9D4ZMA1_ADICA|nr:hypothetical protein GOP47_0006683 [Adiantum capillus-veneris]